MSRIIKRYENRKLYDTEARKYVSLEELANLIRQGIEVKVVDNKTDADITVQTLTQVILEEGKRGRNPLSAELLHEVIRWGSHLLDDGLRQVREGLTRVSGPLAGLFQRGSQAELLELKQRIESLEQVIAQLVNRQNAVSKTKKTRKRATSKR